MCFQTTRLWLYSTNKAMELQYLNMKKRIAELKSVHLGFPSNSASTCFGQTPALKDYFGAAQSIK